MFNKRVKYSGTVIKCPNCGASLQIDSNDHQATCPYCKTVVNLSENISGLQSVLNFVDKRLDKMGEEKRERERLREESRTRSLIISSIGLIALLILAFFMSFIEKREKAALQEQQQITSQAIISDISKEQEASLLTTQSSPELTESSEPKSTIQELIDTEGGVVAYASGNGTATSKVFIIIDTNAKTLTRINSTTSETHPCSGDLVNGFRSDGYYYQLAQKDSLQKLTVKSLSSGRGKKESTYTKASVEYAQAYADKIENWYEKYPERFGKRLVSFGHYSQHLGSTDKPEPIDWVVLHSEGDRTLLVSCFILTFRPYNQVENASMECSWQRSSIRKWLNTEFLDSVFTEQEKEHILNNSVEQDGEISSDRVFLLSVDEAEEFFTEAKVPRTAAGSEYAGGGAHGMSKHMTQWWLRTSEDEFNKYFVNEDGLIEAEFANQGLGIRPAIWVDSNALKQ